MIIVPSIPLMALAVRKETGNGAINLSTPAIIGIIIAVLLVVALVIFGIAFFLRRKRLRLEKEKEDRAGRHELDDI